MGSRCIREFPDHTATLLRTHRGERGARGEKTFAHFASQITLHHCSQNILEDVERVKKSFAP
jgi:hypothetical protein